MFCKNCGNEVKSGKFCTSCGTKIEEKVEEVKTEPVVQEVQESTDTSPITVVSSSSSNDSNTPSNTTSTTAGEYSTKSKIAAGLFGIFLGAFGVHNFYLGYTGKAVAQLLISILSCGTLAIVSEIWGLVEGIMILATKDYKDGEGKLLKD